MWWPYRQARQARRATGHPNIVTVFDAGTAHDGRPYLGMEYFPGGSLADRLRASNVWVICQYNGRANPVVQGATNTWWLYTQGDEARSNTYGYVAGWGYLPATVITVGSQNEAVPGVPHCSDYL